MPTSKRAANPRRPAARRGSTDAPLKNYLSKSDIDTILSVIRRTLAESGARRVAFDYDERSRPSCIHFSLLIGDETLTFRLPARFEKVKPMLLASYQGSHNAIPHGEELEEQVCRTAWATIRDWVAAQLALIRVGMVKAEEIYFPYLLGDDGRTTYFEAFEEHLRLLPERDATNSVRITEL